MGLSFIAKASIQELTERIDAIALVEDYVRLEKKGGRWWGRCPFHAGGQEKTPSFTVDPDKKMYHCFGCGKGGGIIGFVMEMDKISYPEAIKALAQKLNVPLVYENSGPVENENPDDKQKEMLYELYRRMAVTFNYFLTKKTEKSPAYKYIVSRGINDETIEKFNLGYAPADRNWMSGFLSQKGYSPDFLEKSGLFSVNKQTAFFTNRIMFPIVDRQGRTVAFGGRDLPELAQRGREAPRYLNSRESQIFKKGQTLFAVNIALEEIRKSKTAYIAEGYMDVIALHQAGLKNAVAPLGTAFTDEQAKLLGRWAERAILVFDSDRAGHDAAFKAVLTCRRNGLSCSLVVPGEAEMPENRANIKDPADILKKFGPEVLNKNMKCFINDFEYLISRSRVLYDISVPDGKKAAMAFLFPFLEVLDSEIERNDCIGAAADALGTDREAAHKDYDHRNKGKSALAGRDESGNEVPVRMNDELFLLTVVAVNPVLYPEFRRALEIRESENPDAKELFVALEECFVNEENSMDALLARIGSTRLRNFIARRGTSPEFRKDQHSGRDPARLSQDGIKRIKGKRFRARLAEIVAELHRGERNPDEISQDALDELLAEKMRIDADIRKLEGK
jgi:DNA primase